jgi:anthranilate phosphoribosyltransferase
MIGSLLHKLIASKNLSTPEVYAFAQTMIHGNADPAQVGAFLALLAQKGETVDEIVGLAKAMQEVATQVVFPFSILDTCGSGGDSKNTFNISTTAAFVAAGAGVKVAKHGNRSYSSSSGSADVLEALGVSVSLSPELVKRCVEEIGIGFFFAPNFHPAMKHVMPVRKALGIRTVFNILGPLISPALAKHQVLGVPSKKLAETLIQVVGKLGAEHVLIVSGHDGMDELSVCSSSSIWEYTKHNDTIARYEFLPQDHSIDLVSIESLQVFSVEESATIVKGILDGSITDGRRDVVLVNAAAGLIAYGLAESWSEALTLANESIDSGKANDKLNALSLFQ